MDEFEAPPEGVLQVAEALLVLVQVRLKVTFFPLTVRRCITVQCRPFRSFSQNASNFRPLPPSR